METRIVLKCLLKMHLAACFKQHLGQCRQAYYSLNLQAVSNLALNFYLLYFISPFRVIFTQYFAIEMAKNWYENILKRTVSASIYPRGIVHLKSHGNRSLSS